MQVNVMGLSAKDVDDIAAYFAAQCAKPARFPSDPTPQSLALGAETAKQLGCAACHAESFRGSGDAPRLAGQVPTYLAKQIDEFKRGARPHPLPIPALADRLPDASVEALGAYFGKLRP